MTAQHQAPEVTSEMDICPFPECDGTQPAIDLAIGDHEGEQTCQAYVECGCGARGPMTPTYVGILAACRAKQEAARLWNTRATQPLSLTVDEILVVARLRGLLAKATPLPWVRANLANITTKFTQVAPNITSQRTAYRSTDDVLCTEAVNALPTLLDRLQSLSLPVDIDRSGLAQEVD